MIFDYDNKSFIRKGNREKSNDVWWMIDGLGLYPTFSAFLTTSISLLSLPLPLHNIPHLIFYTFTKDLQLSRPVLSCLGPPTSDSMASLGMRSLASASKVNRAASELERWIG